MAPRECVGDGFFVCAGGAWLRFGVLESFFVCIIFGRLQAFPRIFLSDVVLAVSHFVNEL